MTVRLWPRSLLGQMLLSVAGALLIAQGISAVLLWRAEEQRRETSILNAIAFRVIGGSGANAAHGHDHARRAEPPERAHRGGSRRIRLERSPTLPIRANEVRQTGRGKGAGRDSGRSGRTTVRSGGGRTPAGGGPFLLERARRWQNAREGGDIRTQPPLAAMREAPGKDWIVARVSLPEGSPRGLQSLLVQTVLLYIILVGLLAFLLRRITRPLALLTGRVEHFARTREADGQLQPHGPEDVSRLIAAHNAMEDRIAALLAEKDVMLGAIGHDLKTPLAGLRIRIESVESETERAKMAATVEDITRTLDDILSLARVGRPSDPLQKTELSALIAAIVEGYEDLAKTPNWARQTGS